MKKIKRYLPYAAVIVLCGLSYMTSAILTGSTLTDYTSVITEDLGVTRSVFSLQSSIRSGVSAIISFFLYKILEKYDVKKVMLSGLVLCVAQVAIISTTKTIFLVYVSAVIGGIGAALAGVISVSLVIRRWFKASVGTAQAFALSFSGIGGILINPVVSVIANKSGWRTGFLFDAGVIAVFFVLILLFLCSKPEKKGLLPLDNDQTQETKKEAEAVKEVTLTEEEKRINRRNMILMMVIFGASPMGAVVVYLGAVPMLQEIGYTLLFATSVISVCLSIGNSGGKIVYGIVVDKIGIVKASRIWFSLSTIGTIWFVIFRTQCVPIAMIGAVVIGTCAACGTISIPVICSQLYQSEKDSNMVYGKVHSVSSLTSMVALPLYHGIYDLTGSYVPAMLFSFAMMLCAFITLLVLQKKNKGKLS